VFYSKEAEYSDKLEGEIFAVSYNNGINFGYEQILV